MDEKITVALLFSKIWRSDLSHDAKSLMSSILSLVDWPDEKRPDIRPWAKRFPVTFIAARNGTSRTSVFRSLSEIVPSLVTRTETAGYTPEWVIRVDRVLELQPQSLKSKLPAAQDYRQEDTPVQIDQGGCLDCTPYSNCIPCSDCTGGMVDLTRGGVQSDQGGCSDCTGGMVDLTRGGVQSDQASSFHCIRSTDAVPLITDPLITVPHKTEEAMRAREDMDDDVTASAELQEISLEPEPSPEPVPTTPIETQPLLPIVPLAIPTAPTADAKRFLQLIVRWSGQDAPAKSRWKIQPTADLNWYLTEIVASGFADGLDMVFVLTRWDEYLETLARGGGKGKFPVNWKSAFKNQITKSHEWARRDASRADSRNGKPAYRQQATGPATTGSSEHDGSLPFPVSLSGRRDSSSLEKLFFSLPSLRRFWFESVVKVYDAHREIFPREAGNLCSEDYNAIGQWLESEQFSLEELLMVPDGVLLQEFLVKRGYTGIASMFKDAARVRKNIGVAKAGQPIGENQRIGEPVRFGSNGPPPPERLTDNPDEEDIPF